MKKFCLVGLALVGVFAFSATSAFAVTTMWLIKGVAVGAGQSFETTSSGELELIHLAGGFLEPEAKVLCSGIFDGLVFANGEDIVEKLLDLAGNEITLLNMLACTNDLNCPTPLVAAENLPWLTQLELMEPTPGTVVILDLFTNGGGGGNPAYEIVCMGLFGEPEVLCEGETSATVELMAGSTVLLGIFNAEELELEGLEGECKATAKVALQNGEGEIKAFVGAKEEEIDASDE